MLGNQGVGKSALVRWLLGREQGVPATPRSMNGGDFDTPTVGVDFASKAVQMEQGEWPLRLHLWDTSGQERFHSLVDTHLSDLDGSDAVVIVYDVSDRGSFEAVDSWVEKARRLARDSPQIALLANKSDKALAGQREVPTEEGQRKADEIGAVLFVETCAKASDDGGAKPDADRLSHLFTKSLLRRCCAAARPAEPCGNGSDVPPEPLKGVASARSGAKCLFLCPWRPVVKCFGFA